MDPEYLRSLIDVEGQVIALTGGGGILCGMMACGLGRLGAKVAILDVDLLAAQRVADEVRDLGGEALPLQANVLDKESLAAALKQVLERFGRVDVLVNGAGGNRREATTSADLSFFDLPEEAFQSVFGLNFIGTVLASQVFGRHMAEQGKGVILNIASINAVLPLTNIPAYSAAKAAVKNFSEWLAVHMSQNYSPDIRVVALAPGFFLTNQNRFLLLDQATGQTTPRGQKIIEHTPMLRYGLPEELMSTVLWLLSPGASFVHGVMAVVDGGFAAFSGV